MFFYSKLILGNAGVPNFAQVKTIIASNNNVLHQFRSVMPADAEVSNAETFDVGNCIVVSVVRVSCPDMDCIEEKGVLKLMPFDDGTFYLSLDYLFMNDNREAVAYNLGFQPEFFNQFPKDIIFKQQPFVFDQSTTQRFSVCSKAQQLLHQLNNINSGVSFSEVLQKMQIVLNLLSTTLECINIPYEICQVPACRFLYNDIEREKILEACALIERNEGRPFTIRELARKVAINECYIKKGFKAITGKTIHDYQQDMRIKKGSEMLRTQKYSVTDVAHLLGFSSISHFSTAFKRVTGLKPCELLY